MEKNPPKPFVTVTSRPTVDEAVQELIDKGSGGYFVLTIDPKTEKPLLRGRVKKNTPPFPS